MPEGSARPLHWDLMLETGGILRTWALPAEPAAGTAMIAESLADHRLAYLDYEGPLSADRGEVARWDRGVWELLDESSGDDEPGGELVARLRGEKLLGRLTLSRQPAAPQRWRFFFESDFPKRGSAADSGSD
jgi:hypothetical protein